MKKVAVLWDERYVSEDLESELFTDEKLRETMEYFCKEGQRKGLKIYVAHFSSYEEGSLRWGYSFDGEWNCEKNIKIDLVFDKFYFTEETKKLKYRIDSEIGIFNQPKFEELCKDKLKLYRKFSGFIPKTVKADLAGSSLDKLEGEKVVLKPRFGSAGESVQVVERDNAKSALEKTDTEKVKKGHVLLQEFKDPSHGIPFLGVKGVHDLRIIVVDGEPSYAFIRTPESGYISNVSRGGTIRSVDLDKLPERILSTVEDIDSELSEYVHRIYSVDMLFDKEGTPWVIELNSKPGIKFSEGKVTERKKGFIQDIIQALSS